MCPIVAGTSEAADVGNDRMGEGEDWIRGEWERCLNHVADVNERIRTLTAEHNDYNQTQADFWNTMLDGTMESNRQKQRTIDAQFNKICLLKAKLRAKKRAIDTRNNKICILKAKLKTKKCKSGNAQILVKHREIKDKKR